MCCVPLVDVSNIQKSLYNARYEERIALHARIVCSSHAIVTSDIERDSFVVDLLVLLSVVSILD